MTTTRKYYLFIPAELRFEGVPLWQELLDVKTLAAAQYYVEEVFGGHLEYEIGVSINGGAPISVAEKKAEGQWQVAHGDHSDNNLYANDQNKYHHNGGLVSREDFFEYGFKHEKKEYRANCCTGR